MGTIVQLTLIGRQRDSAGEETVTKSTATAEYYEKNGTLYLLYKEPSESSETAAETKNNSGDTAEIQKDSEDAAEIPKKGEAVVHNRIKYKDNLLEVTRNGTINTRMVFENGKEHITDYATPYGCLRLGILTHSLEIIPSGNSKRNSASPSIPTAPKPDAIPRNKVNELPHNHYTINLNEIIIRTSYSLTAEGQPVSDCNLEIRIKFPSITRK